MSLSLSQDRTSFQNSEDTLQRRSKCSKDSSSSLQKVQFGECKRLKRNSLSFVMTMLRILLKLSQFRFKCSTERKRVNVLSNYFLLGCRRNLFFAQNRVIYLF